MIMIICLTVRRVYALIRESERFIQPDKKVKYENEPGKGVRKMTARKLEKHGICDSLYAELFDMKTKLDGFIESIEHTDGDTWETLYPYINHLDELRSFINWKMEIFSKVCPVDWSKHNLDVENTVSVKTDEKTSDFPAGGYVGG